MSGRAAALVLAVLLSGCSNEAQDLTLAQLVGQQRAYDGRMVRTTGVLHGYANPPHYWIADVQDHRVELVTKEDLAPRLGRTLSVRGRFRYSANDGRRIEVETITQQP